MASSDYKLHKTELVALYKLEFYRKQKSWKFAYDGKKTPRSKYTKTRKTLNETYDIEGGVKSEMSPLNKGFLEEVPDKDMEAPKQLPESVNRHYEEPRYSQPWSEHCSEPERDDGTQKWWDTEQEVCNDPAWEDPPLPECEGWAGDGAPLPHHLEAPQAWFTGAAVQTPQATHEQIEELAIAIERCVTLADIPGQLDQLDVATEAQHDASSDSLAEFIRGAHLAPHSSEIDLRDDTQSVHSARCVSLGGASCASVASRASRLSASALSTRVRLHASALAALLRETALRRRHHVFENEYVCHPCRDLAIGAVSLNLNNQISDQEAATSVKGHSNVCILCGYSTLQRRCWKIIKENPTEMEQSMCDIIKSKVEPQMVTTVDCLCHPCWQRIKREVLKIKKQEENRVLLDITNGDAQQEQNVLSETPTIQVEKKTSVETQKITLTDYKRAPNTASTCVFQHCISTKLRTISDKLRAAVINHHNYYLPRLARVCNVHLTNNMWHILYDADHSMQTFTVEQIQHVFSLVNKFTPSINFDNLEVQEILVARTSSLESQLTTPE